MKNTCTKLMLATACIFYFTSCGKKDYIPTPTTISAATSTYSGEQTRNLFSLLCSISQTTGGFFPPQVARAYGYVGIANYEAVVNGIPGAKSLAGQINGLNVGDLPTADNTLKYNWSIASNAAISQMMRKMFELKITSANSTRIDSAEQSNLAALSTGVSTDVIDRSVKFGKDIAAAIYLYSKTDGGHESYMDPFQLPYTMPSDPGCWVPTGPALSPISPKWGTNRPFITANVNVALDDPFQFSTTTTSTFYDQAIRVYNQVKSNTPEQTTIAKYWADDPVKTCTPTGHTFNIMTQLLKENNSTLEKTAVAYAKLSIAENDAFIDCWKGKFKYVLIRPVSYIKQNIDPSFSTVIGTPAFPAYTSGHSCEMGAGSKIFNNMFTDGSGNYQFTDFSQLNYGFQARSYSNFNDMAEECAASRFYGGIHYPMDNERGLTIGRTIGDNVNNLLAWPKATK